jgi:hypothetical protein
MESILQPIKFLYRTIKKMEVRKKVDLNIWTITFEILVKSLGADVPRNSQ